MMRRLPVFLVCLLAVLATAQAQESQPWGMNYQAVARTKDGAALANQPISLRASFLLGAADGKVGYTEVHRLTTGEGGLFNLVIGKGEVLTGQFSQLPWSTEQIWLEMAIDETGGDEFISLGATQLLAVPYAFHALTAGSLSEEESAEKTSAFWKVNGNDMTFPGPHFLGTLDAKDLVFKTNNIERMRITAAGGVDIGGNLFIGGSFSTAGIVTFTNTTQSTNKDNGAVIIEGGVGIEKNVNIGGELQADGATFLNSSLDVDGATTLNNTLDVDGITTLNNNLIVLKNDANFVATFQNANGDTGDGIRIKLGKTHPAWDGSAYLNVPNPGAEFFDDNIATIRGWVEGDPFEFTDVLGFIPAALIVGTSCSLVELLSDQLNNALGLPKGFPGLNDAIIFDAVNSFAGPLIDDDWRPDNPTTLIPGFTIQFPTDFCPDFLPSFSMPNINFVNVNNSLTNANQFVSFVDKDDRELGSIRAMSVTEWGNDYFDGVFLVNFIGNTVSLDPLDVVVSCVTEFTNLADSYNELGVEYASGHGDYAEWLERVNPDEIISRGDIVAVIGGKITKNLAGAEQIMAVSEHPIVLGNLPPAGTAHLGNNVAFMGQIPVKVMGPVSSGDYILANSGVPGYGVAKAASELAPADLPLVVGRSWENRSNPGPNMVNTLVGVHNGDYFRILQKYEQRLREAEARVETVARDSNARLQAIEARVELLSERLASPAHN